MQNKSTSLLLILFIIFIEKAAAQNIAINTTGNMPDTSAMLDITSTNKGLLVPRMTTAQMQAIPQPATGLLVYNTTISLFEVNTGTPASPNWLPLSTSGSAWSVSGNTGTNSSIHFIGTADSVPLHLKTNNLARITIGANGMTGIGTTSPSAQLHTTGTVRLANYPSQVLATNATGNIVAATAATTPNIYTADGALAGNRTVTQGSSRLAFTSTAANGFSVDGTTFSIDAANNRVGINTNAPASYLDVKNEGTSSAVSIADISNNIAGDVTDALTVGINNCGYSCGQGRTRNIALYNANPTGYDFASLDFIPSGSSAGMSGAGIHGIDRDADNGYAGLAFFTRNASNYTARMVIRSSGNIGIGTYTPLATLDVNGTARIQNVPDASGSDMVSSLIVDDNGYIKKQTYNTKSAARFDVTVPNVPNNTPTTLASSGTVSFDNLGEVSATGVFRPKKDGLYRVTLLGYFLQEDSGDGYLGSVRILLNGSTQVEDRTKIYTTESGYVAVTQTSFIADLFKLSTTDRITFSVRTQGASSNKNIQVIVTVERVD